MEKVRLLRMIEYIGPKEWIEHTLSNSIQGTLELPNATIRTAIVTFPEILEDKEKP